MKHTRTGHGSSEVMMPLRSPACDWMQQNGAAVDAESGSHGEGGGRAALRKTLEDPAMEDAGRPSDELAQTMGDPQDARA